MTRVLLVQGHPDPSGHHLCHAIAEAYRAGAETNGHQVTLIDIARQDIPILRSRADWDDPELPLVTITGQNAIREADHIVFVYPLWLGDMPALLKAWFEQVFREGFAFEVDGYRWRRKLGGKSARVIVTMGMPGLAYRWFYLAHSLRSLDRNILKFCGIRPVRWCIFGNAEDPGGKAQDRFLRKARRLGARAG